MWKHGVLVIALAGLVSCAGMNFPSVTDAEEPASLSKTKTVEQLVAQQQFGEALTRLARDTHGLEASERLQLKQKVTDAAIAYDLAVGAAVRAAADKEDWSRVYGLLGEASRNFPDGPSIRSATQEHAPRQKARIAELQIQLSLERAQWVSGARATFEELVATDPRDVAFTVELKKIRSEAQSLATQLSSLGITALNEQNLDLAEKCLTAADRLHPIADNILALERLDHLRLEINQEKRARKLREDQERARVETEKRRQQQRAEDERQQQESRRLTEEFRVAIARPDLLRAQTLLQQLRDIDRNQPQLAALEQQYETAANLRVDELLERGNVLYSNGDIQGARNVWEEARLLSPANLRVRERVQRADQVLGNLRDTNRRAPVGN